MTESKPEYLVPELSFKLDPSSITTSYKTDKLDKAMAAVRLVEKNVLKDTEGFGYKYPQLKDILKCLDPLFEKHKLADYVMPCVVDGGPGLAYRVVHVPSSQFIISCFSIKEAGMTGANSMQQLGATMTYCSRYFRVPYWNITVWDGDGADFEVSSEVKDEVKALIARIPKVENQQKSLDYMEANDWAYNLVMKRKAQIEKVLEKAGA